MGANKCRKRHQNYGHICFQRLHRLFPMKMHSVAKLSQTSHSLQTDAPLKLLFPQSHRK